MTYVQNVTDVDDPLLERATKVGVDWVELAERETELFRQDMTALRVLPPDHYIGAVESIPLVIGLIERLEAAGAVYRVDDDLYFSVTADPDFGGVSGWGREQMQRVFPDRGGDPDRPGKKDPLDCVVWRGRARRASRPGTARSGRAGRAGTSSARRWRMEFLGGAFDVQGGGNDLVFPHHEMCAAEAQVAVPAQRFAQVYAHAGMVGYDGEKMSKSRGNLVFVSAPAQQRRRPDGDPARAAPPPLPLELGVDRPAAVGLRRRPRPVAQGAVARRRRARPLPVAEAILAALADDLDAPAAMAAVDAWVAATLGTEGLADTSDPDAAMTMIAVLDAALGLSL